VVHSRGEAKQSPDAWEAMIKSLKISNIAVVAEASLDLEGGFSVLTGETGAGKSILVDALSLILGARASGEVIRTGEERAVVEALAELPAADVVLGGLGLPADGTDVVIRREILSSGKGRATVNGAMVSLNVLRDLASHLALIHGQHEPQGLLNAASHLSRLDAHARLGEDLTAVAGAFEAWKETVTALASLRRDRREAERRRETLEFQAGEIEKAGLVSGEEEDLRREKTVQANVGRLATLAQESYGLLFEDEGAVLGSLGQIQKRMNDLIAIDPALASTVEGLPAVRAQLDDVALALRDYREGLSVNPARVDEIESRLAVVERLKKKYGASVEEVIAFGRQCRDQLSALGSPEEQERTLEERRIALEKQFLVVARRVSEARRRAALTLEKKVQGEFRQLAMERTQFKVRFEPESAAAAENDSDQWTASGLETAEFMISANPGEDLRPLARIASGGELSRAMLALMSAASLEGRDVALVFDEADAGIGGGVAEVVGKKLKAMAARHQVLCVTHLPQIASLADHHFVVQKRLERGRTVTVVKELSEADRVEEIARMLGGEVVTERAREHAREMLNQTLTS
jgi:DNA repair protein RecN (Recombination protein N)